MPIGVAYVCLATAPPRQLPSTLYLSYYAHGSVPLDVDKQPYRSHTHRNNSPPDSQRPLHIVQVSDHSYSRPKLLDIRMFIFSV